MIRLLLHGALLGAALLSLGGAVEAALALRAYPFERDLGFWLAVWPIDAAAGAGIGLIAALVLPFLAREREWRRLPGLQLASVLAGAGAAAAIAVAAAGAAAPLRIGLAAGTGLAVQQLGRRLAPGPLGWLLASFVSPLTAVLVLLAGLAAGLVGALLPALSGPETEPLLASPAEAPVQGVLLVCLDRVGLDHLGCGGYYRVTSPGLDAVAAEGLLFTDAHVPSVRPREVRTALLGGDPPLPERLRRAGYETAGIGDRSWVRAAAGGPAGFTRFRDPDLPLPADRLLLPRLLGSVRRAPAASRAERAVARALAWLERRRPDRPFFLLLELDGILTEEPDPELVTAFLPGGPGEGPLDALAEERARYDAAIRDLDRALAALATGLADRDLLEETLLVVTSDRGACFHAVHPEGEPVAARSCLTRVPLAFRLPRAIPAGGRRAEPISTAALPATILSFLGLEAQAPSLLDPEAPAPPARIQDVGAGLVVERRGRFVVLRRPDAPPLVRNLDRDPEETRPFHPPEDPGERAAAAG
ncbi:MAG: hypothetical protein D6702_04760 [Planctomycetota bacterium]|nr:MAG: hypothetical protein D6702_04760 [Planctomycetota bacterium]